MPLTTNLFRGGGETDHRLDVVEGHWPSDLEGAVYVVGPDTRAPGSHWFAEHGLIERIALRPDRRGRIAVRHRRIRTPLARIRERLPSLFRRVAFAEVSPFGVSNLANTNVQPIGGRLFVGYDAGRPVEVDPETLRFVTYVGANDEWLQGTPAVLEPLCAVAAHPAPDHDEGALYFVNYTQVAPPGAPKETWLARWALDGPVRRWRVTGMSPFDSIHDVKATAHHLVFTDLPFVVEPAIVRGTPRTQRVQDHTSLWIVAKDALRRTPPGGEVAAVEVRLPMPTGHVFADHEEVDGRIRVVLQHIPLGDLMVLMDDDPEHRGMVALGVAPAVVGRYEIDPATGEVLTAEVAADVDRVWGGVLATTDATSAAARRHQSQLWSANAGFDRALVPEEWWRLYGDAPDPLADPATARPVGEAMPEVPVPGSLARFDLDSMKVAEVWSYDEGAFPSPPTFVPRTGAEDPDDGYLVVVVHRDGDKEVQVFDAGHVEDGPLARASAPGFSPSLLLHSCWMPDRDGPRPSAYRVGLARDVGGAVRGIPGVLAGFVRMGRTLARDQRR